MNKRGQMKNKKAQFYFITALIIILIIISFIVMNNYLSKRENPELTNIQEELSIEIEKLLEYSANNNLTENEVQNLFINFSTNYISKTGYNKNIIFMFGKKQGSFTLKGYKVENSENIAINNGNSIINISEGAFENQIVSENNISVIYCENIYVFDLYEGQNFYYLITKEYKGEKQIIRG